MDSMTTSCEQCAKYVDDDGNYTLEVDDAVVTADSLLSQRLMLALLSTDVASIGDVNSSQRAFDEIGDCPGCLRRHVVIAATSYVNLLAHAYGADNAIEIVSRGLNEDLPPPSN
ncbi:hypothetical protein BH09ACT8_BH09ACT8_59050 [soil metagenome]